MLKFFQNYHKSALGLIIALLICISMLGFGMSLGGSSRQSYAIKVNDQEISYPDFQRRRREIEAQYRRMFGENFYQMQAEMLPRIYQQLVDSLIDKSLVNQFAREGNMTVGREELEYFIQEVLFQGAYSQQAYANFLRQTGLSGPQYENQLRENLLESQVRDLFRHASVPSQAEVKSLLRDAETKWAVDYVEIDPTKLTEVVLDPAADLLEDYYAKNAIRFEQPIRVRYDYLILGANDFQDLVEIQEEDIELFYTEHTRDFRIPPQVRVSHIELRFPEQGTTEQLAEVKERALELLKRAKDGEDFSSLVQQYSDDIPSRVNNGDLGWIKKGDRGPEFEKAAFALTEPGVAELVEVDYGYHVLHVDEVQEASVKDLVDVRNDIEKTIREREAPAYAAAKAHDLFDEWVSGGQPLSEFSAQKNLAAVAGQQLFEKREDPSDDLKGLTAKVLKSENSDPQIVQHSNSTILVQVTERKEADVPPLEEIKDAVTKDWKHEQSVELSRKKAQKLVDALHAEDGVSLRSLAEVEELEVKEQRELAQKGATGIFADPEVRRVLFSLRKEGLAPSRYFRVGENLYLFQITGVEEPGEELVLEKLETYRSRTNNSLARDMTQALSAQLKSGAEIDIQPGVLTNS